MLVAAFVVFLLGIYVGICLEFRNYWGVWPAPGDAMDAVTYEGDADGRDR